MILLKDILRQIPTQQVVGDLGVSIAGLTIDSRSVQPGCVFFAIIGTHSDGHAYIEQVVNAGVVAVVCQQLPKQVLPQCTYIVVANVSKVVGPMAAAYYGDPSQQLKVVGVTGTNGKTTTATLLYQLYTGLGYCCGLISTVQNHIGQEIVPSTHTTPHAIAIQSLLAQMVDAGCSHVFMEVSSHAVHQHRIDGIAFTGGIFTNISHDHLDYHKTFDEYIQVKKAFFDHLPATAFALSNADDKRGAIMLQNTSAASYYYSLREPVAYKGKVLENNLTGLVMHINHVEAHFRMIGIFNAYNLLAVYGTAMLLGQDAMEVLAVLSNLPGAKGRFETVSSASTKILGIVDYAHTPDALVNVLTTIQQLRDGKAQLITVVGCGGDRDKTKRPIMAEVACEHSDKVVLTSDNPRSENPEDILNDMRAGLNTAQKRKVVSITDRREAIKVAVMLSQPGDIILIAGKGHETYQEIQGVKTHFDDMEVFNETCLTLGK